MRKSTLSARTIKWVASAALLLGAVALLGAQQRAPDAQDTRQTAPTGPGMEPFTPTKLQWLTLELNATLSAQEFQQSWFLRFDSHAPDQIVMEITYNSARTNQELMKRIATVSKGAAEGIIKDYGFDSWAKIEDRFVDFATQNPDAPGSPAQPKPTQPKSAQPPGERNP